MTPTLSGVARRLLMWFRPGYHGTKFGYTVSLKIQICMTWLKIKRFCVHCRGIDASPHAKEARCKLQSLNNRLFEEICSDVYDEVDRRENDAGMSLS